MGPEDALEARTEMIRCMADDRQSWAYEAWAHMRDVAKPGTQAAREVSEAIRGTLTDSLQYTDPYWVAPQMVDLLEHASHQMPPQPLDRDHLPSPMGLIYLSRPLELPTDDEPDTEEDLQHRREMVQSYGYSDEEIEKIIRASKTQIFIPVLVWADIETMYSVHGWPVPSPSVQEPGVMCSVMFRSQTDVVIEPPEVNMIRSQTASPTWLLLDSYMWLYGMDYMRETIPATSPTDEKKLLGTTWLARLYATFWTLVDQELTDVTTRRAARPFARRAERAGLPSELKVVTLRHRRTHTMSDEGAGREYSHQWIVDGHWRNQPWGPGRTKRRLQWIAPYVKGPEDAPLVVKDTVYSWRR